MAQQPIIIGEADAKAGDTLFSAFTKTQANFTDLYATSATKLENSVTINSEADFETQDATTITLTAGLHYQLGASFSTTKRFIGSGSFIRGLNSATTLTYTGTGSMSATTNGILGVEDMIIDCPNGTVFECIGDDSGNPNHRINAERLVILNCVKLLTSTGAGAQVFNLIQVANLTGLNAVTFSGSTAAVVFDFSQIAFIGMVSGSTVFDFGSVLSSEIDLESIIVIGDPSTTAMSGLSSSGNISVGGLGMVEGCNFSGLTTPLSGIEESDIRWDFEGNSGNIKDSKNAGDIFLIGGSETIAIASAGDWAEIGVPSGGGVTWDSDIADRFTVGNDGVLTYIGERPILVTISARATIEKVGGGANVLEARVALNWTGAVSDGGLAKSRSQTQNPDPTTVALGALVDIVQNDNIRIIFSNTDGTSDVVASVASLELLGK